MSAVRERIYEAAAATFDISSADLDPYAAWTALVSDSLRVVELTMALEEAFEIEFDDDEIATMKCLDDLVRAVEGHLGDEGAAGVRVPL
jgi:acyl carrier protein